MTGSMGPIYDRSKEHLGTTDAMVIRVRRRLIAAIHAHLTQRDLPPGVDNPEATACARAACSCPRAPTGSKPRASCARRSSSTPSSIRPSTARCE